MIPDIVKDFLLRNNEKHGCFCIALNSKLEVIRSFGQATMLGIVAPKQGVVIYDVMPELLTESFLDDFEIPFFNITPNHVCNIYFLKFEQESYLLLVDKSEIFQITQKYQQFAHDDNISKNKFKRLAEDLEKAKGELNKSNQEKATLIAMLSHELGTPLTSIIGYSELLLKETGDPKKHLNIINRNAIHLKHMIENTLLFGRTQAGVVQAQLETISASIFLEDLYDTLLPAAQNKGLNMKLNYQGTDELYIDITSTKQILINLINNAIKYTDHGSVSIELNLSDNRYVFSVCDTGLGVPLDLQSSIFQPWERVKESQEEGTGIGLFISQNLAKSIGGTLFLKSSNAKDGSIFQLIIPIKENTTSTESKTLNSEEQHCIGKSLLIIDDDRDILDLLEALLEDCGLIIYSALNFNQAESVLETNNIDIILTDYYLGAETATAFITNIRPKYINIPILLMTAMPTNETKKKYKNLGFNGLITKPIDTNNLLNTIMKNIN